MPTPERIVHCRREPAQVFIGRPSPWGNPWAIGPHGDRADVIWLHEQWLRTGYPYGNPEATEARRQWVLTHLGDLKGKTLGCYCEAPLPCHGHTLLTLLREHEEAAQGEKDCPPPP